jgi:uncharacterized protein with PQ loop repeat
MTENIMLEVIGWAGAFLFCVCGLPQAWKSIKEGHSDGLSTAFLQMWIWGEILTLIYVLPKWHWPLIANYVFNIILILIILRYKYFPRFS